MIRSDIHAESTSEIVTSGLDSAETELLVINPSQQAIRELVDQFRETQPDSEVKLFADQQPLKELVDDFLIASITADLIAEESLSVRTLDRVPRHSLLLTEEFMVSLVDGGDHVAGLTSTDDSFVTSTFEHYHRRWQRADEFSLRMPPLSHIRETLESEIGTEAVEDFDRILSTLETARGNGDGLDEVTIALLVAANNGELLYDISRWGEDIRLASKATFSRTKNRLEDNGLIETEKVPIDVGRPRLRLMLADDPPTTAGIEEVAQHAQGTLQ